MSFDEVYKKHYHEIRRFGRQMNISPDGCKDLIQETFIRFYLETGKKVIINNPRAWLYKVFLNLSRTYLTSERRKYNNSEIISAAGNATSDLQEDYIKSEKQSIVFKVLTELEEKEQEILLLYHHGFSYAEMAEILRINPNSIGKTLVRAIDRLKETLKIQYHEMFEQN